jgi:hypothetical protein
MNIRPVGVEFFHVDGRTDMTKLIVAFQNFANAPTNRLSHLWHSILFMIKSSAFREVTFITLHYFYDQSFRENNRNFISHWSKQTKSLTMKTLRWPLFFCNIISSKRIINRAYVSNRLRTTTFPRSRARSAVKQQKITSKRNIFIYNIWLQLVNAEFVTFTTIFTPINVRNNNNKEQTR